MLAACTEEIETYSGESGIYFAMSATKGGLDDSKQDYTAETQIPLPYTAPSATPPSW